MSDTQVLLSGLAFGESPRWHQGRLWFSHWGTDEIIAIDPQGKSKVVARVPTALPFCIDWLHDGRLLVVSGREGLLLRQESGGELVTHATLSHLAPIWNEIVVDGRGNIYVNGGGFDAPGVIAVITPDGTVRQVAEGLAFPNGMAVTPDNKTLIVAESHATCLTAFDINADGNLSRRRVWADLAGLAPDGICLDSEGAVWYATVPGMCCVRVKKGGEVLQRIQLDRGCFACMLGGQDKRTLFMLAAEWHGFEHMMDQERTGKILIANVSVPGVGWPS
ncbi:SMP-30/gluconolactonase/LRE family protein [Dictyobacter aurantiacus]|uniref:Gluconolaconase n=1 Tax=Dictyobacter aurantiacus TaxID=1936993 RepID=A0A401ZKV5_9CHLR|nr:SMP-30/gluconolactonase/LRE family protein [Dictyobacter aurantiacus]GCE07444.1 gluconolaconase [Dictyobacter aurantiacus]